MGISINPGSCLRHQRNSSAYIEITWNIFLCRFPDLPLFPCERPPHTDRKSASRCTVRVQSPAAAIPRPNPFGHPVPFLFDVVSIVDDTGKQTRYFSLR